jgi:hypothetical protein
MTWLRDRSQGWLNQVFLAKRLVQSHALVFVLRSEGTAAEQIAGGAAIRVPGDAFPEHVEHRSISIVLVDASPAQLENLSANLLERAKIKKFFAVIAKIALGAVSALHAIGADQLPGGGIADHQMVTDEIELVAVQTCLCGIGQPFSQFAIEDQKTEALAFDQIVQVLGQPHAKEAGCGERVSAVVYQDSGFRHDCSF